jgi:hypothetical protein
MKRLALLLVVLTYVTFAACSGGNEPSIAQLETAVVQRLPANVAVDSFSVDEMEQSGNDDAPEYGARFRATVRTLGDLYEKDSMENGVLFVRLNTPTGSTTEVVGRIRSRVYQGSWQHNVGIDGDPVADLGTPLDRFFGGRVIVRGSVEEKKFYAEAENKHAAPGEPMAAAARMLVGTWRDENSRCKYNPDGSFWEAGDSGIENKGRWRVQGDILQVEIDTQKQKDADEWYPSDAKAIYKIIAVEDESYSIFNDETGNTYHGKRVR